MMSDWWTRIESGMVLLEEVMFLFLEGLQQAVVVKLFYELRKVHPY